MGSFNRKSEFQKPENLSKPITKGEKINVAELSLLKEFWRNNYAHVVMTAEADRIPTDAKQSFENFGIVGYHSNRSNGLAVHARIDSTSYVRILWESIEEDNELCRAAIFEVKFGKMSEGAITDSLERRADLFFWRWDCCISHWRQRPQHHWWQFRAYCKMYSGHHKKATGDQIKSSETTV